MDPKLVWALAIIATIVVVVGLSFVGERRRRWRLNARGYPLGDFDERAADISVDDPRVVVNYRAARHIARRHTLGEASTEDLRQALVHYRALFEDLLDFEDVHSPSRIQQEDRELVRGR